MYNGGNSGNHGGYQESFSSTNICVSKWASPVWIGRQPKDTVFAMRSCMSKQMPTLPCITQSNLRMDLEIRLHFSFYFTPTHKIKIL